MQARSRDVQRRVLVTLSDDTTVLAIHAQTSCYPLRSGHYRKMIK